MRISNAEIYNSHRKCFIRADLNIEDGKFSEILYTGSGDGEADKRIIPGFIDIHSHGAVGVDIFTAGSDKLIEMSNFYAKNGITTLFPASISETHENIMRMIEEVKKAKTKSKINFEGIHIEGPYINKKKAGAHSLDMIKDPDLSELDDIMSAVLDCGLKLHITIAPELGGAFEFIETAIKKGATISLGHTEADGETVRKAWELGANSFTHLFNAMPQIHHRDPGTVTYALVGNTYVEVICDGIHLHPAMIRAMFKLFGAQRICLISDSVACAGLEDGQYMLAGQDITVSNGKATLADGTIAGSSINLLTALRRAHSFGIPLADAVTACTKTPALSVGLGNAAGAIEDKLYGDCLVLEKDLTLRHVIKGGELTHSAFT